MSNTFTIGDAVSEATKEAAASIAEQRENIPAAVKTVRETLKLTVPKPPKRKQRAPRPVTAGPATRSEAAASMRSEQASIETFTNASFVSGVMSIVESVLEHGVNQEFLGEFVASYQVSEDDVKIEICRAFPGGLSPDLQADAERKIKPGLYHLAWAIFSVSHADLMEDPPAGQSQRHGEKRLSNWLSAYRNAQKNATRAMDASAANAELARLKESWERNAFSVPADLLKKIEEAKVPAKKESVQREKKPEALRSANKVLNALYLKCAETLNSHERIEEYRDWLYTVTIMLGYDPITAESVLKHGKA